MAKYPKYALILFDVDGCTSIVATSKIQSTKKIQPSLQCIFSHCKTEYKIEVLRLSDSKQQLNAFEKEWSQTERAKSLDREKDERGDSEHGYLSVWPEDMQIMLPTMHEMDQDEQAVQESEDEEAFDATDSDHSANQSRVYIEGSNSRKITIYHEGSGDQSSTIATPQRSPVFMDGLSQDQTDCVFSRITNFTMSRETTATQTDDVLIFKNKEELLSAYDPKGRTLEDVVKRLDDQEKKLSSIFDSMKELSANSEMLIEILTVVKGLKEERDISRLVSVITDLNGSNVMYDSNATSSTTEVDDSRSIGTCDNINSASNNPISCDKDTDQENQMPLALQQEVESQHQLEFRAARQQVVLTSPTVPGSASFSNNLLCNSGPIVEISSYLDMEAVDHDSEVRIAPFLQKQFHGCSSWTGGFAWQIAQRIYRSDELIGKNYYGKMNKECLSPRRRHAIEHAVLENAGDNVLHLRKAVEGINTGIRNKTNKMKGKADRTPMAPRPLFI